MKDYLITVTVKNNYLWEMMKQRGIATVAELHRLSGISYSQLSHLSNFAEPAINKDGSWKNSILRLADFFNTEPECLVPPQHVEEALEKNRSTMELSSWKLDGMLQKIELDENPIALIEHNEAIEKSTEQILSKSKLNKREKDIIDRRFGLNGKERQTLSEVADHYDLSRERIRHIEMRVLRKMRDSKSGVKAEDIFYE